VLGSLFLAAALSQGVCADCGLVKDRVRLCAPHAEAERMAFNGTRKQLASEREEERIAALESLSRLTRTHVNAPSEKVARRIADALRDEFPAVRECAVGLLGPPQHALVSMEALLGALSAAEKELPRLTREKKELQGKLWSSGVRGKEKTELELDLRRSEHARESLLAWRRIVLARLGHFPDERVVTALREIARPLVSAPARAREIEDITDKVVALRDADERLPEAMDVNGTLVRLGNREAVRTVIVNLTVLQAEIAEFEQWDSFPHIAKPLLRGLEEARIRSKGEIAAALSEKAMQSTLPDPSMVLTFLEWLQQNLELFPEHLPGVSSPAW
jgi:hypothetical protein